MSVTVVSSGNNLVPPLFTMSSPAGSLLWSHGGLFVPQRVTSFGTLYEIQGGSAE